MGRVERDRELARKRARRAKLKKLRAKYAAAKTETDKKAIFEKARKISPFFEVESPAAKS
jgi:hypothetical protein